MFFLDVETNEGAATAATLLAQGYKPSEVGRFIQDGKTTCRVGFPDAARDAADNAYKSPFFTGAAYAAALITEAKKRTPLVYKELAPGKALILSADTPPEEVQAIFDDALKV